MDDEINIKYFEVIGKDEDNLIFDFKEEIMNQLIEDGLLNLEDLNYTQDYIVDFEYYKDGDVMADILYIRKV